MEHKAPPAPQHPRREFTITKFERHEDGYLHARVVIDGKALYVHRRYGAWMAPGTEKGREVLKEVINHEIKVELQRKARALERHEKGEDDGRATADTATEAGAPAASADSETAG